MISNFKSTPYCNINKKLWLPTLLKKMYKNKFYRSVKYPGTVIYLRCLWRIVVSLVLFILVEVIRIPNDSHLGKKTERVLQVGESIKSVCKINNFSKSTCSKPFLRWCYVGSILYWFLYKPNESNTSLQYEPLQNWIFYYLKRHIL